MKRSMLALFLVGWICPLVPARSQSTHPVPVEKSTLASFSDADIENLRRVMKRDDAWHAIALWRAIVENWHRKSPQQQEELRQRLQESAAQPSLQEWSEQNRPGRAPSIQEGFMGALVGGLAMEVALVTSHALNAAAAHEIARGGTATVSRFFSRFFNPMLVSRTGNTTLSTIGIRWARVAAVVALGALAGWAALHGAIRLAQNYRHGKEQRSYEIERFRLGARLLESALATSPMTDPEPSGTTLPADSAGPGHVAAELASEISGDDIRVADRP